MSLIAQVGLSGLAGLIFLCIWISVLFPVLFLLIWYLPEVVQLIRDKVIRRDLMEEFEEQREMEGRLFDPRFASLKLRTRRNHSLKRGSDGCFFITRRMSEASQDLT